MGFLRFAGLIFLGGCLLYSYQASLWVCPASRQGRDSGSGKSSNDADAKEGTLQITKFLDGYMSHSLNSLKGVI